MNNVEPSHNSNKICYFYNDDIGNYNYGIDHPMKPLRITLTDDLIFSYGIKKHFDTMMPIVPSFESITRFHADSYIQFLQSITTESCIVHNDDLARFSVGDDCPVFDGLWEFCELYTGSSIGAAQQLVSERYEYAINWSGGLHHGKKHEASGFCYINDCVLAALELLKKFRRIAYVDIDVHHGDGVEEAFYTSPRVMCISFHKYGDYFPGTGALSDIGVNLGKGYSVNVPLKDGINDFMFDHIFKKIMDLVLQQYQPEAIIIQGGADSLSGDRLGCFNLTEKGHSTAIKYLMNRGIPLLALGGGGYTIRNVPRCWTLESATLAGVQISDDIPENSQFRCYYGPEYKLPIRESNMINYNSDKSINDIIQQISDNFRQYVYPVNSEVVNTDTFCNTPQLFRQMNQEDLLDDKNYDSND